jgi:hypothetical protein
MKCLGGQILMKFNRGRRCQLLKPGNTITLFTRCTHQLLVNADRINLLGGNRSTMKTDKVHYLLQWRFV